MYTEATPFGWDRAKTWNLLAKMQHHTGRLGGKCPGKVYDSLELLWFPRLLKKATCVTNSYLILIASESKANKLKCWTWEKGQDDHYPRRFLGGGGDKKMDLNSVSCFSLFPVHYPFTTHPAPLQIFTKHWKPADVKSCIKCAVEIQTNEQTNRKKKNATEQRRKWEHTDSIMTWVI